MLMTLILHSQSTWTLGSQVQTKHVHKTCNSNCTMHGQIFYFSQYHFTALDVTVLEMKELSLSLEHWEECPTCRVYSKLTYTLLHQCDDQCNLNAVRPVATGCTSYYRLCVTV